LDIPPSARMDIFRKDVDSALYSNEIFDVISEKEKKKIAAYYPQYG